MLFPEYSSSAEKSHRWIQIGAHVHLLIGTANRISTNKQEYIVTVFP